jgi:Zn-dependent protease with chaperone function
LPSAAYEGKKALVQLDNEGSISVYGYAVVTKNADGTASIKQGDDAGPLGTLVGTSLGSLITIIALCLIFPTLMTAQALAQTEGQDEKMQMGQEVFNELKAKGEIIESSPLYDQLDPIADAITRAAQPRYNHPFKFYLVRETQPNAFATPGGNV